MSRSISQALAAWLAAGKTRMGEVAITAQPEGDSTPGVPYSLRHWQDANITTGLTLHTRPEAAREIALYDAVGQYRPLKTAPTLIRGWQLTVGSIDDLQVALDGFYPAMLAARLAIEQQRLAVTPLRETLGRQSGMYTITKKITDAQADALIGSFCSVSGSPGCLKQILWPIAPGIAITSLPPEKFDLMPASDSIPMLCAEACNLLVARAREVVKQSDKQSGKQSGQQSTTPPAP